MSIKWFRSWAVVRWQQPVGFDHIRIIRITSLKPCCRHLNWLVGTVWLDHSNCSNGTKQQLPWDVMPLHLLTCMNSFLMWLTRQSVTVTCSLACWADPVWHVWSFDPVFVLGLFLLLSSWELVLWSPPPPLWLLLLPLEPLPLVLCLPTVEVHLSRHVSTG